MAMNSFTDTKGTVWEMALASLNPLICPSKNLSFYYRPCSTLECTPSVEKDVGSSPVRVCTTIDQQYVSLFFLIDINLMSYAWRH